MTDLIQDIEEWIEDGASFPVQLQLLTVDSSCSVSIGSFTESECRADSEITNSSELDSSDSVPTRIVSTYANTRPASDSSGAVVGVIVATVFILVLIAAAVVTIVVILRGKRKEQASSSVDLLDFEYVQIDYT